MHGIYSFFNLIPSEGGDVARHRAGRLLINQDGVHHLEDYHGSMLRHLVPSGPLGEAGMKGLRSLRSSPYVEMVHWDDWLGDKRPSDIPEEPMETMTPDRSGAPARPPAVFEYRRAGMDKPHILEANGPDVTLDGNRLSVDEVRQVMRNSQVGAATLRYKPPTMAKAEKLAKAEKPKGSSDTILKDPMIPKLGNILALDRREEKPEDIFVIIDINDFWRANEAGMQAGDELIIAFGEMLASCAGGSAFRYGGDSFIVIKQSKEEAWTMLRKLLEKERALPPISGESPVTLSAGVGRGKENAQKALTIAKQFKYRGGPEALDSVYTEAH